MERLPDPRLTQSLQVMPHLWHIGSSNVVAEELVEGCGGEEYLRKM